MLFSEEPSRIDMTKCIPAICQVQDQILGSKLPKDYHFHGAPAPWAQQIIIKFFRNANCKIENREEVIKLLVLSVDQTFLKSTNDDENCIDSAVIYECIETLSVILMPGIDSEYDQIMRKSVMRCLRSLLNSQQVRFYYLGFVKKCL